MNSLLSTRKNTIKKYFEIFYHLWIFCMLFDWGCPTFSLFGFIGLNEIAMVLAGATFLGCVFTEKNTYFTHLFNIVKRSKGLCIALALYLIYGVVTIFIGSELIFVVYKYINVVQMVLFALMTLYYLIPEESSQEIRSERIIKFTLGVGISSGIVGLFSFLGYYTDLYTSFFQKISPIDDYNQYTSILLMGLICMSVFLVMSKMPFIKRYLIFSLYTVLISVCVIAAGSRRSDALLIVVAGIITIYAVFCEAKRGENKINWKGAVAALCAMIICISVAGVASYYNFEVVETLSKKRYAHAIKLKEEGKASADLLDKISKSGGFFVEINDALSEVVDGSGMNSREIIWNVAINDLKRADTKDLIFGRGATYSWDLFDNLSNPDVVEIRARYYKEDSAKHWLDPHNLFLQDMLEGGAILLFLQLCILLFIAISMFRILFKRPKSFAPMFMANMILYATLFLSSSKGMVAHKFFWVLIALQIVFNYFIKTSPKKIKE